MTLWAWRVLLPESEVARVTSKKSESSLSSRKAPDTVEPKSFQRRQKLSAVEPMVSGKLLRLSLDFNSRWPLPVLSALLWRCRRCWSRWRRRKLAPGEITCLTTQFFFCWNLKINKASSCLEEERAWARARAQKPGPENWFRPKCLWSSNWHGQNF